MVTPGLVPLSEAFESQEKSVSLFTIGVVALWTTIGGHITVAGSDIWGRRPFYVVSLGVLAFANLLASVTLSLPSLVIMRAVSGLASAPFLLLTPASVADVFFAHERGTFLAALVAASYGGGQLGIVIAGFIVQAVGVSALFKISAAAYAALFVAAYFYLLETAPFRRGTPGCGNKHEDNLDLASEKPSGSHRESSQPQSSSRRIVFVRRLSNKSFVKGLIEPFLLLVFPAVAYSVIVFGVFLTLVISLPVLVVQIVGEPPYKLPTVQAGLVCLPLAVISVIGGPSVGALMDVSARFMAGRNKDIKGGLEPEFRLTTLLVCGPLTTGGLVGLSVSTSSRLPLHWVLFWLCVTYLGSMWTTQAVLVYVVDCLPALTGQTFTLINLSAAIGIFVASDGLVRWELSSGTSTVCDDLAILSGLILLPTLPMYVFGKRIRGKLARSKWTPSVYP
ncbi:MFS-1 domain containing protein [Ophiocordyceps camponoti-floridani]|uniref:MFS-1 domain containing protein n=1 Tax=Ophiocordyceps camponoti-floridani TaxID=2030778 RepID=A0A8H4Q8R4_9HYPO|nr:MFS-1 domain containing protein [Ophiocordyceps camponoti-floridani]